MFEDREDRGRQLSQKLKPLKLRDPLVLATRAGAPLANVGGEMYYGIPKPSTDELMKMLHDVKPTESSVPVEYRLITGNRVEALVRLAKEEAIDLIALGSRAGLSRLLMGSVAEGIVRKAKCPVLVCKQPVGKPAVVVK